MSKTIQIWLITAGSLIALGLVLFVIAMTAHGWDFSKLSTVKYESNTHEINESFSKISIHTDITDIQFLPSKDGQCKVVCLEDANDKHSVTVQDDTLVIHMATDKKWYQYVGIHTGNPKLTIYLPQNEYASLVITEDTGDIMIAKDFCFDSMDISVSTGDVNNDASVKGKLKIETSTGDICINSISTGALDLSVSTGHITASNIDCLGDVTVKVSTGKADLRNLVCQSLSSTGNTGDLLLKNVLAAREFSINRSTGDVTFDGCDAAEIFVTTDTGDVTGTLLSEKVFILQTDTGDTDVPKTVTGGRCEITTDTGDIRIKLQ
ncbi:MAG: DUF4097 domain-containing protein [Ruminococcaceae bacterium]|nr:DUF4097 domain-containing protein [Oscillospiraceae bacterium]